MRPDFSQIDFEPPTRAVERPKDAEWKAPEHIAIKSHYTAADLAGLEHLKFRFWSRDVVKVAQKARELRVR